MRSQPSSKGKTHAMMVPLRPKWSMVHPPRILPNIAPTASKDWRKMENKTQMYLTNNLNYHHHRHHHRHHRNYNKYLAFGSL